MCFCITLPHRIREKHATQCTSEQEQGSVPTVEALVAASRSSTRGAHAPRRGFPRLRAASVIVLVEIWANSRGPILFELRHPLPKTSTSVSTRSIAPTSARRRAWPAPH